MFNFLVALFNPVLISLGLDILRKSDLKIQTGTDTILYSGPSEGLKIRVC